MNMASSDPGLASEPMLTVPQPGQLSWLQIRYAWKAHRRSLLTIVVFLLVLGMGLLLLPALKLPWWNPGAPPPDAVEWLSRFQNCIGILTLAVAVIVWWSELREDWEEELPKRMSIFFFTLPEEAMPARPAIVCRNVWLAGADDLRQWAMQVAGQAVNTYAPSPNPAQLRLDFGPDVYAGSPRVLLNAQGRAHKHYSIRFNLTRLPESLKQKWADEKETLCLYQNLAAPDHRLRVLAAPELEKLRTQPDWPDVPER